MDLNHVNLNSQLIAELYSHVLLEPLKGPVAREETTAALRYLGHYQKQILILTEDAQTAFLEEQELSFLTNVLLACKLSLADVGILNLARVSLADLERFILNSEPRQILLFGVPPLNIGLPINFPEFQVQPFNQRTYLYTPPLRIIESDKGLKARLWNSLKSLFGI
jgi:hypothetical protein